MMKRTFIALMNQNFLNNGGMEEVMSIQKKAAEPCDWLFPFDNYQYEIPQGGDHRGAFGAIRTNDVHTGVDLYCPEGTPIHAVEDGEVVHVEIFTGPRAESPWWHETFAVLVEGASGVVCYGEIFEPTEQLLGKKIKQGDLIGHAKQVLKRDKGKPMCMLHFEWMKPGTRETFWWKHNQPQPEALRDPTGMLLAARKR